MNDWFVLTGDHVRIIDARALRSPLWLGQAHRREVVVRLGDGLPDADLGHSLRALAWLGPRAGIILRPLEERGRKGEKGENKLEGSTDQYRAQIESSDTGSSSL